MAIKINLTEDEIPRQWYNLAADMPNLLPFVGPDGKAVPPEGWAAVFPMNLVEQEYSKERWINIPEEVLELLYRWRPSPLRRAVYLEKALVLQRKLFNSSEFHQSPFTM